VGGLGKWEAQGLRGSESRRPVEWEAHQRAELSGAHAVGGPVSGSAKCGRPKKVGGIKC